MTHAFIDLVNAAGQRWAAWMIAAAVDSAALLLLVSLVWFVIRRRVAPQVGYCLFLLVPLKLLLPIDVSVPPQIARWTPSAIASRLLDEKQVTRHSTAQLPAEVESAAVNSNISSRTEARSKLPPVEQKTAASDVAPTPPAPSISLSRPTPDVAFLSPADATQYRITTAATAMLVWLGVVALLFGRLAYAQLRFWSRLRCAKPIDERQLNFNLRALLHLAGIRRVVQFVESDDIAAPAVAGIIRPAVILPRGIASSLTSRQLRWVLLHELAHVRRHDILVVLLQRLVAMCYFFNPIMWIANRMSYRLREYVCDDFALSTSKTSAVESSQAFLEVLRYAADNRRMQGALGIFGFDSRAACLLRVERLLDSDRMIRIRASAISMCFVGFLAIVALPYVHAATKTDKDQLLDVVDNTPPNLSGVVKSADGKPIEGALVTIYSAGVRVGYSSYCPTCYADCGKRAATAADGTFTIEKLDPSLVFRVLVIVKGYEPKFAAKVDPVKAPRLDVSLKARPAVPDDRTRVVAGQVLSPGNTPLAGALIEPFGCKTGKRRWWGSMPGVDPLAVSDDNGHFEIVTAEPVDALDLEISARATATRKFALVPSGNAENHLRLSAGASVQGRLLDHGQPLPGVSVGLVQTDRSAADFMSATQIGTDADGQFVFTNVPPDREYFVYGIMNSLRKHGAVAARKLKVAGDNTKSDAGDLNVELAFRVAGRVALSDGKPLPAHTRVLFSRDDAWDTQTIEADANGNFEVLGIPKGGISINACLPNYHTSDKNKSYEPLNGFALQGLITADIDGLTILLEPGAHNMPGWPEAPAAQRALTRTLKRLKAEPPVGVTADLKPFEVADPNVIAAPPIGSHNALPKIDIPTPVPALPAADADVPQRSVTGRVGDQDGKPVAGAEVWMPVRWASAANFLTAHAKCASDGTFELKFPAKWISDDVTKIQSTVWAYANGHSIGTGSAFKQLRGEKRGEPCDIHLGPPTKTAFTVLLPDGRPAVGVQVKPQHFLSRQGYEYVPPAIVAMTSATADSEGYVEMPAYPIDKMLNVNVVSNDLGMQQFQHFKTSEGSNVELKLQPVGRIEGRVLADQPALFRDMLVEIETGSDPGSESSCTGQATLTVDQDGRFVVPHIAQGMVELSAYVDNRLPVRPRLPERGTLEVVPGKTTRIEVPLEMTVNVHGTIRIKGTDKPVAGAKISVNYGVGRQSEDATSDDAGKFTARVLPGNGRTQVIYVPNGGATQLSDSRMAQHVVPEGAADFELPPLELIKTKTLSGRLLDKTGKPLPKRRISGINGNGRYGFGESDKNGDFKLTEVPEGLTLEKFEVWSEGSGERPLDSVIDSTDPLVVRLK
jgi:beta-lactamase regulating signal transducer with metallopeptidase domain